MFKTTPFKHQAEELAAHGQDSRRGLFWEQGTGKTKVIIDTAATLYRAGEITSLVVVAPNSVHTNWITDELPLHMPDDVADQMLTLAYQASKASTKRHKAAVEAILRARQFAVLAMSYDAVMTTAGRNALWQMLRDKRTLYVLDESARIKTPGAKRTIRLVRSGVYAPYRRILTGTPVSQGPFDIYSQIRFLDNDFWKRMDLATFGAFQAEFGIFEQRKNARGGTFQHVVDYKNLERLRAAIDPITTRVIKDEVLDLPPKLYSRRTFDLAAEQRRLYNELRDEFITELDGQLIDAPIVLTRLLRLQQIACGYLPVNKDEPEREILTPNPRIQLLLDVVEDLTHPTIIWARFRRDIDLIMLALGPQRAVRFDGRVDDAERTLAKQRFKNGDVQFFVANPAVGGEGLTMVNAKTVIYYSNSFKLMERLQSEDRAHRIGQGDPVHYIDLQAVGTVDIHITRSLRKKFDLASQVTGDVVREWL